ncbi:serpin family protein [Azospirillum agricola]|uniref:serpin family protein n=1 Tax=Azospirillum agricola TaxID=1720247 RepID=UPI000A0F2C49|nr:serpin family protein [Azospirillum agricola]SMH31926.1 serpin B [Azospirillum lipoferum]
MPVLTRRALLAASTAGLALAAARARPAVSATVPSPAFLKAVNALGLKALAEQLTAAPKANHAVSPLSLGGALTLLAQGAAGGTEARLRAALGGRSGREAAEDWRHLRSLTKPRAADTLTVALANGLWHAPGLKVGGGAAERLKDAMAAAVAGLDFTDPKAVETVNAWARDNSDGMIPALLDRLEGNTELVLASALAFKANWATAFAADRTQPLPFAGADGATVAIPTMARSDAAFAHRRAANHEAVLLPYADPAFALVLALPGKGVAPAALLADGEWLDTDLFIPRPGELLLPRVELSPRYDLTDPKASPTMATLLSGPVDLSGLGKAWQDNPQTMGQAVQAVALRWDESGTQAAAATAFATSRGLSDGEGNPFTLHFDRPFAFALLHLPTGAILLAGAVNRLQA